MTPLRQAIPRATLSLHSRQLQALRFPRTARTASTNPPPKPRVLEKPDKFRPPSHPSRIRTKGPRYVGPALSDADIQRQKTKQYPHMMPPEGSFMHWFLTNRTIHLYISLSILITLVGGVWLTDFLYTTPYLDLLPPNSMFFAHPISFLRRWYEVYEMHVAYVSAQTAERRRQKVEDVRKRSEYRKAHGLEDETGSMLGGWSAKSDDEVRGPALREGLAGRDIQSPVADVAGGENEATYVDFEGRTQPLRKKWLGIW